VNGSMAASLLLWSASATPAVHDGQIAALRAAVASEVAYVCVAVNAGVLQPPVTRAAHLESTKARHDPPPAVLENLRRLSPAFVAASECTRTEREWDIIHRVSRKSAQLVVVGEVEVVTPSHVRVVVLTTSGFLSDTHTLFEVERVGGVWTVTSSRIILQA
jgi:hypothetical protein